MATQNTSPSHNRGPGRPIVKALVVAGMLGMGAASVWAQSTLGSTPVSPILGGTNSMQGQTLNNTTANDRARSGAPLGIGTPSSTATGALPSSSTAIPGVPAAGPSSSTLPLPGAGAVGGSAGMGPGSAAGVPGTGTGGAMGGSAYGSGLSTPGAGLSGGSTGGAGGMGAASAGAGASGGAR